MKKIPCGSFPLREITLLLIFLITLSFIGDNKGDRIKADGLGYYDYLPSLFIHHDLVRKDASPGSAQDLYQRIAHLDWYNQLSDNNRMVNKYPVGVSILLTPFFGVATLFAEPTGDANDGYQAVFQQSVYIGALFYLFLALLFFGRLLRCYEINRYWIFFFQTILVLATSVIHYTYYQPAFSHIYSLFAVTAFLLYSKRFFNHPGFRNLGLAALCFGCIVLLRPVNGLIIFFLPFLAGSFMRLTDGLRYIIRNPVYSTAALAIVVITWAIQPLVWYLQTGNWLIYSYGDEYFRWSDPHITDILFSYRKGLFVYTPIMLIACCALVYLGVKRSWYLIATWVGFFSLLTYVLASWWSWFYGCSYGLRAYVEYYPVFLLPFAMMLKGLPVGVRQIFVALGLFCIPLNLIQTYQYREYILHWIDMDAEGYWKVFLKTDDKYKGLLFKKKYNYADYDTIHTVSYDTVALSAEQDTLAFEIPACDIPGFQEVRIIQIRIDGYIPESLDGHVRLSVYPDYKNGYLYRHQVPMIQFPDEAWETATHGLYNYEFQPFGDTTNKWVELTLTTAGSETRFEKVSLHFLRWSGP